MGDLCAAPRDWPKVALPQEVGSNLEEFVGNLGMQPVACPWNGVVVHVQEVLLKKLEILVGHVVAFASRMNNAGRVFRPNSMFPTMSLSVS